jgi:hypothetical protein
VIHIPCIFITSALPALGSTSIDIDLWQKFAFRSDLNLLKSCSNVFALVRRDSVSQERPGTSLMMASETDPVDPYSEAFCTVLLNKAMTSKFVLYTQWNSCPVCDLFDSSSSTTPCVDYKLGRIVV